MIEDCWRKIIWSLPNIERIAFQFWQFQKLRNLHPALWIVDVVHLLQQGRRQQLGEPAAAAEQEIDWR